jgi:HK97 gp10 family phage protein
MATKMQGREALVRKLKALSPATRSAIKQAIAQGADELVALQKRLAPVRTGELRDSIVQTWGGQSGPKYASLRGGSPVDGDPDLSVLITAGNSAVRYAHLVEFGTAPHTNGGKFAGTQNPGTSAHPFFYSPYRALKRRIKSRITRATTKAAKAVAAGGGGT